LLQLVLLFIRKLCLVKVFLGGIPAAFNCIQNDFAFLFEDVREGGYEPVPQFRKLVYVAVRLGRLHYRFHLVNNFYGFIIGYELSAFVESGNLLKSLVKMFSLAREEPYHRLGVVGIVFKLLFH